MNLLLTNILDLFFIGLWLGIYTPQPCSTEQCQYLTRWKRLNFLPRYSLLVLYRAYVLPIFDYGDIIFDNCTATDSNLLESVQTAAAKIILERLLGLTPLFIRRQFHILKAFRANLFGPCPSFLSTLAQILFKSFRLLLTFHTNVQLPSWKTHSLHNFFFIKAQNSEILYPLIFII